MSDKSIPHIRTPRSLLENDLWKDLPPSYKDVFNVLLENVCFYPQKYDDHGVLINLEVGQWCGTYRDLVKLCGKYGDKNVVERSIKKFILYEFVRQEVRHKKSIITITHKDTYELIKRASETRSESILRQDRDRIETEIKNIRNKEYNKTTTTPQTHQVAKTAESQNVVVVSSFDKNKFEQKPSKINEPVPSRPSVVKMFDEIECARLENKKNSQCQSAFCKKQHNLYYQNETTNNNKTNSLEQNKNKTIHDYSFLDEIGINEKQKEMLLKFPVERVRAAVEYFKEVKPNTTLIQGIIWHCQFEEVVLPPSKEKKKFENEKELIIKKNRELVLRFDGFENNTFKIDVLSKHIEFVPKRGQCMPCIIPFSENGFQDQFLNAARKYQFDLNSHTLKNTSNFACV